MVILGIDPGTASTGYGAISLAGSKLKVLTYGVISTPSDMADYHRLKLLHENLLALFESLKEPEVAVEQLFFNKNTRTALAVGQARGVALLAAANAGCDIGEYTPPQVKLSVVGYGGAKKAQVQYMVKTILSLKEIPEPDDAADALAVAICHAHSRGLAVKCERALKSGG